MADARTSQQQRPSLAEARTRLEAMRRECAAFHKQHPEVWELFEQFALEAAATGRQRFGVAAIWERLRWETMVNPEYRASRELKLNNNFRAFYARRFMRLHPEHEGFFETRVQKSGVQP